MCHLDCQRLKNTSTEVWAVWLLKISKILAFHEMYAYLVGITAWKINLLQLKNNNGNYKPETWQQDSMQNDIERRRSINAHDGMMAQVGSMEVLSRSVQSWRRCVCANIMLAGLAQQQSRNFTAPPPSHQPIISLLLMLLICSVSITPMSDG